LSYRVTRAGSRGQLLAIRNGGHYTCWGVPSQKQLSPLDDGRSGITGGGDPHPLPFVTASGFHTAHAPSVFRCSPQRRAPSRKGKSCLSFIGDYSPYSTSAPTATLSALASFCIVPRVGSCWPRSRHAIYSRDTPDFSAKAA